MLRFIKWYLTNSLILYLDQWGRVWFELCLVRFGIKNEGKARHRIWMVWGWKPWKLARFTTFGPGRRSMSVATNGAVYWGCGGWNKDHSSRHFRREFAMNGLFYKGVLPRGLPSEYILRVNRYSVHTLSITQFLFEQSYLPVSITIISINYHPGRHPCL